MGEKAGDFNIQCLNFYLIPLFSVQFSQPTVVPELTEFRMEERDVGVLQLLK